MKYRHKKLWWIIKEQDNWYDATQPNTLITTIPKELIEDSQDRELIEEKDWIGNMYKELWMVFGEKDLRKAIEKHIPKITEREIFKIIWPLECWEEMTALLKSKWLLAE